MKTLVHDLSRTAPGRAIGLAWGALPVVGVIALISALALTCIQVLSSIPGPATAAIGAATGTLILAGLAALATGSLYRRGVAAGALDAPAAAGPWPAFAAGTVLGIPAAVTAGVLAGVSAPIPAVSAPVPPAVLGLAWLSALVGAFCLALLAPFALRRAALGGLEALRDPGVILDEALAAPVVTLRLGAATLALIVAPLVFGPAALLVVTPLLLAVHVLVLDGADALAELDLREEPW